jgi:ketosteroid isomerase-like protein
VGSTGVDHDLVFAIQPESAKESSMIDEVTNGRVDDRPEPDTTMVEGATVNTQRFLDALREVEEHGNVEPMTQLFAEDARIWNPELQQPMVGREGARRFWREYKDTFATVHSEFRSVIEGKNKTALEWTSSGTLEANRQPFQYRGVSIIEWSNGQIVRFAAYFDPRALAVAQLQPIEVRRAEAA